MDTGIATNVSALPLWLKRHPFAIDAFFDFSLVLTYAFPQEVLQPLLPPGLSLDTYQGSGFLAIAMVQTRELRPAGFPKAFGQSFFLTGYRLFVRHQTANGKRLRGLYILRSDTNQSSMVWIGNLLTHYGYHKAQVKIAHTSSQLDLSVQTLDTQADLQVIADLSHDPALPPAGSPFPDWREARKFSGPLPFTFSYEPQMHSLVWVEGVRQHWQPKPLQVDVLQATFLNQLPFNAIREPQLANAFSLENIPYHWKRGVYERLIAQTLMPEGGRYDA
ncbi:MAG TPA: DUF2071 domain-containing protein [Ktedonosporobacter sp.]|nr:DUF2071 domain-containing protein [Ktedonosporobacter sp.]